MLPPSYGNAQNLYHLHEGQTALPELSLLGDSTASHPLRHREAKKPVPTQSQVKLNHSHICGCQGLQLGAKCRAQGFACSDL